MIVRNKDQRSHDYGNIANTYRPDMLILALTANMVSGTTEAADVPPDVKPSAELLQVLLQQKS